MMVKRNTYLLHSLVVSILGAEAAQPRGAATPREFGEG